MGTNWDVVIKLISSRIWGCLFKWCRVLIHYIRIQSFFGNSFKKLISLDFKNAFNCLDSQVIFDSVLSIFPDWRSFLEFSYGKSSNLFFNGDVIKSMQGVKQGDPLGPFLYSLTTSTILSYLNSLENVKCIAYLDDTYVLVGLDVDDLLLYDIKEKYLD
ncbi:hypothetical protein RCL1_008199 [Eukaryota sp. TZLM3-RCL]